MVTWLDDDAGLPSEATRRVLLMDGAMGTHLLPLGLPCVAMANLSHGSKVRQLHRSYVEAGAEVLLTNTFAVHPAALAKHHLDDQLETICRAAIGHARAALPVVQTPVLRKPILRKPIVLGNVGPAVLPGRRDEFSDRESLLRVLDALDGVDGLLFETCSTPSALTAVEFALHRVSWVEGHPLLLSLSFARGEEGKITSWSGHAPEVFARHARRHGVSALGVNCGIGMRSRDCAEVLRRYREETDLPLFARPSAGLPGELLDPAEFAQEAQCLVEAGAFMVGGCCGTGPEHIRALAGLLQPKRS